MDENNTTDIVCISNLFSAVTIVNYHSPVAPSTVPNTVSGVIIVIQLTDKIPSTCTYRLIPSIIVRQSLKAGRSAFADLSALCKVNGFPVWDMNTKSWRLHSSSSSL